MEQASSYYQKDRVEVVAFLPDKYSKVLEIGCGAGSFRAHLSQPCEYWGVEPVEAAAEAASPKLTRVLRGTFEDVYDQLPDDYFDLVICNDVIEHMADHDAFFQAIKRKMRQDSCLIGSVPNIRYIFNMLDLLIKKEWIYREEGVLDRTHLRFFTERSLKRAILENGFTIEELHGINKSVIKPNSVKQAIRRLFVYIIGLDSQFVQFGFRIKPTVPSAGSTPMHP